MKLPDGFWEKRPIGAVASTEAIAYIVRDCAKVCNGRGPDDYTAEECATAILSRYGLHESSTEQLVTERVGPRGPHVG